MTFKEYLKEEKNLIGKYVFDPNGIKVKVIDQGDWDQVKKYDGGAHKEDIKNSDEEFKDDLKKNLVVVEYKDPDKENEGYKYSVLVLPDNKAADEFNSIKLK